jgi:hypothetical protein
MPTGSFVQSIHDAAVHLAAALSWGGLSRSYAIGLVECLQHPMLDPVFLDASLEDPCNRGDSAAAAVYLGNQRCLLGIAAPTPAFRADDLDIGHHEAPSGLQKETAALIPCQRDHHNACQAGRLRADAVLHHTGRPLSLNRPGAAGHYRI